NGVAERRTRTLIKAARTMLVDSKLPTTFWAEVVNTACYVLNRVLVIKHHNKTPYELIHGRTPLIDFMKLFGCPVTILNTRDHLVEETLNIRFLENTPNVIESGSDWLFDVDSLTISMNYVPVVVGNQTNGIAGTRDNIVTDPKVSKEDAEEKPTEMDENGASDKDGKDDQATRSDTPVSAVGPSITNDDPSSPVNAAESSNAFELESQANKHSKMEPKKVIQALEDTSWIEAMQEELLQFQLQKVWTLVNLPNGKRAIGTKWLFRNKKDERGIVVRNKARLVAQGYTQEEGIDYDEVFTPVARIEAIRLFLAYASFMGFIMYQMDVKSVFLYGTIDEEVYVCQPPGFEDPQFPDKVYKVEKALYGLHQAPRA
ncbi:retrovirus-related pol polyprotein from transposon TNT 1-94, partial [Tanacetum coccineum]